MFTHSFGPPTLVFISEIIFSFTTKSFLSCHLISEFSTYDFCHSFMSYNFLYNHLSVHFEIVNFHLL